MGSAFAKIFMALMEKAAENPKVVGELFSALMELGTAAAKKATEDLKAQQAAKQ